MTRQPFEAWDIVPCVAEDLERRFALLTEELSLARTQLAQIREQQEKWDETQARLRASRERAARAADVLAECLAERFRDEILSRSRRRLPRWLRPRATEEEELVLLIWSTPLFDPAWYLRHHLDAVRSREDPALHFIKNFTRPVRDPGPNFDTAMYLDNHPEVLTSGINPLVHFLQNPQCVGAESYPVAG